MAAPAEQPQANRWVFWVAVVVVLIGFYTPDYGLIGANDDAWGVAAAEQFEQGTSQRMLGRAVSYLLLAGLGTWALLRRGPWPVFGPSLILVTAYVVWCLLSITWSDNPRTSLMRCIQLGCMSLAALGLGKQLSPTELCKLLLLVIVPYCLMGLGAELAAGAFKPWVGGYRFSGGYHPNSQSQFCILICLAAAALYTEPGWPRWRSVALFALGFALLVATGSRTATISLLVALGLWWALRQSVQARLFMVAGGGAAVSAAILIAMLLPSDAKQAVSDALLMGRNEEVGTLTGRLPLWQELVEYARERPVLGYGFAAFWNLQHQEEFWSRIDWVPVGCHNAYLEALLNGGIVAMALLALASVSSWLDALRAYLNRRDGGHAFLLMFFTTLLIGCLSESLILLPGLLTFIWMIGITQLQFVRHGALAPARGAPAVGTHLGYQL